MEMVTMVEFRSQSAQVLRRLARGERLLLTHRGHPVATLEPVTSEPGEIPESDAIHRLEDFAFDGPGEALRNEDIDRLVYEDPDRGSA